MAKTVSLTLENGDTYEGEVDEDNTKAGRGTFTWYGGGSYEGEWHDDKKHGHGKMVFKD